MLQLHRLDCINISIVELVNFIFLHLPLINRWIFSQLPLVAKQVIAVSATYPEALANLVARYMNNPSFIRMGQLQPALLGVKQFVCKVPYHPMSQQQGKYKLDVLLKLLKSIEFSQCMIFTNLQTRYIKKDCCRFEYLARHDSSNFLSIHSFNFFSGVG